MITLLSAIAAAALVNNLFFVQLLGVSPLFAGSRRLESASELALFGGMLLFAASCLNLQLYRRVLVPLGMEYLSLFLFMMVSALLATMLIFWLERKLPLTARRQQLAIALLGCSSAVIGFSLVSSSSHLPDLLVMADCLGTALGFSLALIAFAALRQRTDTDHAPEVMRGAPLDLITAGLAAMCFLGFTGLS